MKLKPFTLLGTVLCAFLALAGVQRSDAAPPPATPVTTLAPGHARTAVTQNQAQAYAQREKAASQELKKFAGGSVYIAISGVGAFVVVILLIALLV